MAFNINKFEYYRELPNGYIKIIYKNKIYIYARVGCRVKSFSIPVHHTTMVNKECRSIGYGCTRSNNFWLPHCAIKKITGSQAHLNPSDE